MKANKALKRIAKIEALISDVTERYSKGALHVREALHDAKAAFARVQEAISSQAPSKRAKNPPAKRKKAAVKKAAAKAAGATAAPAPVKKTGRFSSAQRKKQAERMKAFWAAKRKAEAKSQPTTASKSKKTAPRPVKTAAPVQAVPAAAGTTANIAEAERATGTGFLANT